MAERRRACILAGMGNKNWPDEIRTAARSLYLRRYAVSEIADMLSVPVRTLYNWASGANRPSKQSAQQIGRAFKRMGGRACTAEKRG